MLVPPGLIRKAMYILQKDHYYPGDGKSYCKAISKPSVKILSTEMGKTTKNGIKVSARNEKQTNKQQK